MSLLDSCELAEIRRDASVLDGSVPPLSFSTGRYITDDLSLSPSAMYDRAAIAEEKIKGRFDERICVFDESMRLRILQEQEIISEMIPALKARQFKVWFQPQYNHATGALVGAEALVRWLHPQKGIIPPGDFIPIFEKNGFVYQLDKFVWRRTCELLREWLDKGLSPLPVSVNISRYDLFRDDLTDVISGLIEEFDIPTELLRLEITESAFAKSSERIIGIVTILIERGFTVEIDDFGSGYSSLNTLKDIPAQIVKLDMRFLKGDNNSERGGNILESIVRMTKWLGMAVIAEGVETENQADFLKSIGCCYIQGYLYSRPMPEEQYEKIIVGSVGEEMEAEIKTVENLDNNLFWDPASMDTLIFNSYIGGACIMEWNNGQIELLRVNDNFAKIILGRKNAVEDILNLDWKKHMDKQSVYAARASVLHAVEMGEESSFESVFSELPGATSRIYLRISVRVIARVSHRCLIYCTVENITTEREADELLRFLNETARSLLTQSDMNDGINGVLMRILDYFGGNRAYVFELDSERNIVSNTYEVCAEGVESQLELLQSVPASATAFWFKSFEKSSYININNVEELDESRAEERNLLELQGVRSLIAVPLLRDYKIVGFVGVDDPCRQHPHVGYLRAIGDYLVTAITHIRLNAKIENDRKNLLNLMADTPGGFARLRIFGDDGFATDYVNQTLCRMRNMSYEDIMLNDGKNAIETIHPDDREYVVESIRRMSETEEPENTKYRMKRADGSYMYVNAFGRVTCNENGERFINVFFTDISEKEKRELSVRDALPYVLSAIMESTTDRAFVKDKSFRYICCSPSFVEFAGKTDESDIIGKTDFDIFPQEAAELFRNDDETIFANGKSIVDYVEPIPSDDEIQHYSSTSKYVLRDGDGEIIGLYGTGRDITEYRKAFEHISLLTDNIPGGIASYISSPDDVKITYFNDGYCKLLGYTHDEYAALCKKTPMPLTFAEDVPVLSEKIRELKYDDKTLNFTFRVHNRCDDGFKWVNIRGAVSQRKGDIFYLNTILFDVTETKLAEEEARIREREIKLALSKMGRMISEYDIATRTLKLTDTYADKYSFPQIAHNVPDSMQETSKLSDEDFKVYCDFYNAISRGEKPEPIEVRKKTADGTVRWERMTAYTVFGEDGKPVKALIAADNTTEQHMSYELERRRPLRSGDNMVTHALFNLTRRKTLEYFDRCERPVPIEHQMDFIDGKRPITNMFVDNDEFELFSELHDVDRLCEKFENGETEFSIEYRRRLISGEVVWVRNILRTMRMPVSNDILLFEYCYNIDDEKLLEIMNRSLIDTSYDYVIRIYAKTHRFISIFGNGATCDMPPPYGDDSDYVARSLAENSVHPDDIELLIANTLVDGIKSNLEERERYQFVVRQIQSDGTIRYKKLTQYYLDRALETIIVTREDVTQIMEEENSKNQAIADALEAAKQASRAKTQFLSRMSHELRTPMNAILGLAALSAADVDKPRVMEDNIAKIGMSARYLLSLINDILEMSRIESGKMTLSSSPFDFEQFISNISAIIYPQASEKGIDYDVIINSYLEAIYVGDSTKLQEVLVNILGNAIKFTAKGGKVTLAIEQLKRSGKNATLRFSISDTGIGIEERFIPHMFEPFSQEAENLTSSSSGTGLGLAICKNLVEMMNVHITVQSVKNVGSVFTIDVQLGISDQSRQYLDLVASMNLTCLRALVVDDDIVVCRSTESVLSAMGMKAEWVDSGLGAIERVKRLTEAGDNFDTIFIDWKMPGMNGIETTLQLRKIVGHDVTIIIITAYDWHDIELEAREAGADIFVEKPLFQSSIVRAFEKVFLKKKPSIPIVPADQYDFSGRHFLVAEDNALNVEITKRLLEKQGAEITVAGNGLEAMEIYTTAPDEYFDLILMDIRMPIMDGLSATRNIRNLRKAGSREIPIVAMTANAFDDDVELSLASGMDAHLAKPVEPETMFATLRRLLKK